MRAVAIDRPGGPDVMEIREVQSPEPGPGEIRVAVRTSALNRADLLQRRGHYPAPAGAPRDIPGLEYAGEVDAVGEGVARWSAGDRVMGLVGGGGYAEYVVVHQGEALPVPERLSFEQAAAVPEAFLTAHDALFTLMRLEAGQRVLIHAVASGVGTAAAQLARAHGATVFGTSRTAEKLERVMPLGLTHAIDAAKEDFAVRVSELTGGEGVHGVLDLVGGGYLAGNVASVALRGCIVVVGLVAGRAAELDLGAVLRRRITIIGTVMRARPLAEKIAVARRFEEHGLHWLRDGVVEPVIDRVFGFDQVGDAHRLMERDANVGKIVLRW